MHLMKLFCRAVGTVATFFLLTTSVFAAEIPLDHWAAEDMLELTARGILQEEKIEPDAYVTRAEFTQMIVTSLDLKLEALRLQGAPASFIDVPTDHPLKGYINAAKERGLVGGYTPEIFKPEEELQRAQMVVLLLRVMGIDQLELDKKNLPFTDIDYIPDYALPSISEGVRLGLVKGYADNSFRPGEKVTLSEAAAFINRWLDLIGDRYDYYGIYQSFDSDNQSISLEVSGNLISMPLSRDVQIISNGTPISWRDLEIGSPIAIKLNIFGEVIFIQGKKVELSDIKMSLDTRILPKAHLDTMDYEAQPFSKNEILATSNLFSPRLPMDLDNIQKSLDITKGEINLSPLESAAGTDGKGKVVAIIDTGVDPSHPDLAFTTDGKAKIVDWVDFTLEGLVHTSLAPGGSNDSHVKFQGKDYNLGDIPSKSGLYRMGLIQMDDILPLDLVDFTTPNKDMALLLTDSNIVGKYDTIYIDTNQNQSFLDESALRIYRESKEYIKIPHKDKELALVAVDIDPQGDYVQLANDISGHGTHVAGVIAANGNLKGIAPGAQLMVLKAVDRDGFANPKNIVEAIRYGAIHGADVINISLGQYQDVLPGQSDLAQIVNEVVTKYGVVVVTAAGNTGPGINTVAAPADADSAISVGAFVSSRMWEVDFGYRVPEDSLYYFSSVGPRRDGAWYPTIIAPGSVVSTVPGWMEYPYMLTEGTSMATPHVSGVVAHLLEAGDKLGIKTNPAFIK
ncbi:MAG: S8 family serine peptidase, partial [Peptococcales bacterium]